MAILIVLGIMLYFAIGAIIVGVFNEDLYRLEFEIYLFWPVVVPSLLLLWGCTWLSDAVHMWVMRVKNRRGDVNRKD